MPLVSYFDRPLGEFLSSPTTSIVGELTTAGTGVDAAQLGAWHEQIVFLKSALAGLQRPAHIYFEFFYSPHG